MSHGVTQADAVATFFRQLQLLINTHRSAISRVDRFLSTRFNVFESIMPQELELTRIISNLLSPDGTHGQGGVFLKLFLDQLTPGRFEGIQPRSVVLEKRTTFLTSARRIDLLLDFGSCGLGIENKPLAGDQPGQISDYLAELQHRYPGSNYCLIYLTQGGREPSVTPQMRRSEAEADRLLYMTYQGHIVPWLES